MSQFTIGIIIVIFGVILTTIGGYVAKDGWDKIHHKNSCKNLVDAQQASIGNDNTQVVTTGDKYSECLTLIKLSSEGRP